MSKISAAPNIPGIQFTKQAFLGTPAANYLQLYARGDAFLHKRSDGTLAPLSIPNPGGRLTLTTGVPVTTADVTAAGTIYYTPYTHDLIDLYDGASDWIVYQFGEPSLALTVTSGLVYDIFMYSNAGVPTLESLVWASATARATALVSQNGRWVKSGAPTRRYMGSICASGANVCEDSITKRFLFNVNNRVMRQVFKQDSTATWTMSSSSWRQTRATAANRVECVIGLPDALSWFQFTQMQSGGEAFGGIGLDTVTPDDQIVYLYSGMGTSFYTKPLPVGYHAINMCERGISAALVTFYSGYSGANLTTLSGWVLQ